jgi:prevent-host-death family protein
MQTATVVRLKTELSRYLRLVKGGDEIIVTERGVAVARLVPIPKARGALESLRDLERQGLIRLGSGRLPRDFWLLPRARDPRAAVLKALLEERDTGR